jgi:DNA-binding LacI/PurR family transcriptional regulator
VAASERLAAATWRAARHLGLRVPADLSVVSVDDAPWMGMVAPPVTAGERDGVALGVAAVDRLLGHGGDGPTVAATRVLHRGSTAPPPGAVPPTADPVVTRVRAVQS